MKSFAKALTMMTLCAAAALPAAAGDDVAIKTNLLYDATATINLGLEFKLAPKWTLDASGNFNNWSYGGKAKWKHWLAQPEVRYWFCEALHGNFIGLELHGGQFNVAKWDTDFMFLGTDFSKVKDTRYQGWFAGAGLTYGHAWMLAKHWNFEAEIGFGWSYVRYDRFPCKDCGKKIEDNAVHNYVGPTKAALSLVYIF